MNNKLEYKKEDDCLLLSFNAQELDVKKVISNGVDGDTSLFTYEATIVTGDDDNYKDDEDFWFSIWDNENKTYIMNGTTAETTYENLGNYPEIGISVERYVSFPTDYKFVLANNYSIFYRIEEDCVKVIRIIYSRRDFVRILFGDNENT